MNKIALIILLGIYSVAHTQLSPSYDANTRCQRIKNSFTLNGSNVNALISLSCSALSHVENEQKNMVYEDSATLFHQWQTIKTMRGYEVKGYCSIPYPALQKNIFERHRIDLKFSTNSPEEIFIEGTIAGKHIDLMLNQNSFLDTNCPVYEQTSLRLERINLGIGFGMTYLIDMLQSKRTGASLSVLKHENWIQGQNSITSFSGLGLQYRMSQINGRQLVLSAAESSSSAELHIRSSNYLEYAEDTPFTKFKFDTFSHPRGFLHADLPVNHKFQAYPIQNGAQVVGCTSLIYDGELDIPQNVDLDVCKQKINNSELKHLQGRTLNQATQVKKDTHNNSTYQLHLKIEKYLNQKNGKAQRYAPQPHTHQMGYSSWTKADIQRGFVVTQRIFQVQQTSIIVREIRYNSNGKELRYTYTLNLDEIP